MHQIIVTMTETITYETRYTIEEFAALTCLEPTLESVEALLHPTSGGEGGEGFDELDAFEGTHVLYDIERDVNRVRNEDREWHLTTR